MNIYDDLQKHEKKKNMLKHLSVIQICLPN